MRCATERTTNSVIRTERRQASPNHSGNGRLDRKRSGNGGERVIQHTNGRERFVKVGWMLGFVTLILLAIIKAFLDRNVVGKWDFVNQAALTTLFSGAASSLSLPPPPVLTMGEIEDAQGQLQTIYESYANERRPRDFILRGVGWLHAHLGLVLTVKVVFHPRNGKDRRLTVYVLDASGTEEKCDEEKARLLTIWIRVMGQYEIVSGDAQLVSGGHRQSHGSCLWQFTADLVTDLAEDSSNESPPVPLSFKVDAKVLGWNAHVDYNYEPMCNMTKGLPEEDDLIRQAVFESPQKDYSNSSFFGFKFYNPDETCCEICSRLPNCVRWAVPGFTADRVYPFVLKEGVDNPSTDCELIVVRTSSEAGVDDYDYLEKVYDVVVDENSDDNNNNENHTVTPSRLPFGKQLADLRKKDIQTELLLGRFPRPPSASVNYTDVLRTERRRVLANRKKHQYRRYSGVELHRYSWINPSNEETGDAEQDFVVDWLHHRQQQHRRRLQDNVVPMHGVPRTEPLGYFLGCGWSQWLSLQFPCVSSETDDAILNSGLNFILEETVAEWKTDEELQKLLDSNDKDTDGDDEPVVVKNAYESRAASFPLCTWEHELLNSTSDLLGRWVHRPGLAVVAAGDDCPKDEYPLKFNFDFSRRVPLHFHAPNRPLCWHRDDLRRVSDRCMELGCKFIKDDLWHSALFRENVDAPRWFGWWQPSTCRYMEMTDDEINDCFRRRRFAKFSPAGRSIMHFFTDYFGERLSTVHHEPVDKDGNLLNPEGATYLHVDSLEMPWALCQKSEEAFRIALLDKPNATATDVYYYLSGFYFSSERGAHVTAARSQRFNEIAEEILLPKGWHVLNAFDLTRAFAYDTSAQFDGMHILGPPMKALVTKTLHHFCHSSE